MVENGGNDRIIVDFDEEEPQTQSKDLMTFIRDLEDECRDLVAQKNSMISKHTPERAFRIAQLRRKIAEREEQIRTQLQKNAEIELIKQNAEKSNPLGSENINERVIMDEEVVQGGGLLALDATNRSNPGTTDTLGDEDDAKVASNKENGATAKLAQKTQLKRKYESLEGSDDDNKKDNKKPKQDKPLEPVKPFRFEFKKVGSSAGNGAGAKMDVAAGVKENMFKLEVDAGKGAGDKDVQDVAKTQTLLPQKISLLRLLIKDPVVLDRLLRASDSSSKDRKSLTMPKDIEKETMKKIQEIWKDNPSAGTQVLQYTRYIPTEYSQQGLDEKEAAFMKLVSRFTEIIRSLVANDKMTEIPVGSLISLLDNSTMSLLRKHFTLKSFLQQGSDRGLIPKTCIKNGIAVLPLELPKDEEKNDMNLLSSATGASQKNPQAETNVPLDLLTRKPNMSARLKYKQIKALLEIKHKTSIPHYNVHTDKSLLLGVQRELQGNQIREPPVLKSLNFWPSVRSHARPYDLPSWMDNIFTGVQLCKPCDTSNNALKVSKEYIANGDLGNSIIEVLGLLGSVFLDLRSKKSLDIESFTSAMKHQWDTKPGIRTSPLLLALMLRMSLLAKEQPVWQDEILGLLGSAPSYHGYIQAGYSFCPNIIRGTGGSYLKGAFIMISGAAKIAESSQSSERNADIILDLSLHHVHLHTMVPLKSRSATQFSDLTANEQNRISTYYETIFTALSRYPSKLCILLTCMAQHYIGKSLPESVVHHLGYPQPDQNPELWCWRTRFPAKQSKFAMVQAQKILQQGLRLLGNNTFVRSATKEQQDAFNIPKEVAIAALRSCITACQEKQNLTPSKKNKLLTQKRKKGNKATDKGQEPLALLQKCEQTSETVEPLYWPSNFFSDPEHASNFPKDKVVPLPFMLNILLEPRSQYNVRMVSDLVAGIEFIDSDLELKSLSDYIVTTMGNNPDASLLLVELLRRMAICFQLKPTKASLQKTCFGYFLSVVVESLWQAKPQVSEDVWMKAAMILRSVSQDCLSELILLCIEKNQYNLSFFQEIATLHSAIKSKV